jgi:hypothetical protein
MSNALKGFEPSIKPKPTPKPKPKPKPNPPIEDKIKEG